MTKKIEVKVSMFCAKCKTEVLRAVTKLKGINQVTADEEKGVLTIIGNVDPVAVMKRLRKLGKMAEIISVGPPKKDEPPKSPPKPLPKSCSNCNSHIVAINFEHESLCTIL